MIKPEFKSAVATVNARLRVDLVRVRIEVRGDRLAAQATLPPRPGSAKSAPHQQRISLGLPANAMGLRRAERLARLIGAQLVEGKFTWTEWLKDAPGDASDGETTAADLIESFRQHTSLPPLLWRERYLYFGLNKIPGDRPLTPELIIAAALTKEPDTRARQVACERLGQFAKFAGVPVDLSPFVGNYGRGKVQPRDLPSDDEIESVLSSIANPQWRSVFWCMAVFGCRDHEVFFSQLEPIGDAMALHVLEGKTGPRFPVMPMPARWLENVDLANLPKLAQFPHHTQYGKRCAQAWRRQTDGVPWSSYGLRHAFAIRCHRAGVPVAIAAKWMGHSQQIHMATYTRWISQDAHLEEWRKANGMQP
jgi:integrase